jgi:hypothetical protein
VKGKEQQIISRALQIMTGRRVTGTLGLDLKMKAVELLATLVYRGFTHYIKDATMALAMKSGDQQDSSFLIYKVLADDMNTLGLTQRSLAEDDSNLILKKLGFHISLKSILQNSNDEFEKLINARQAEYFGN